jgi:hypothetical protein
MKRPALPPIVYEINFATGQIDIIPITEHQQQKGKRVYVIDESTGDVTLRTPVDERMAKRMSL